MKFYEFDTTDFSYYALIGAKNQRQAMDYYKDIVADILDKNGQPIEITKDEAFIKLINVCITIEDKDMASTEFEINTMSTKPYLILMDGNL